MSDRLSVLMCVYNETEFIDYAIRSVLPHVDDLVIVEGAYQETIELGASPRSDDGTLGIIDTYRNNEKITIIEANEKSDPDQRNKGLEVIKKLNPDGWLLIVDGDEVYAEESLGMVRSVMRNMSKEGRYAAYFKSLTFVNDLKHYTFQDFPRLFKITPSCEFINDNFMAWKDEGISWAPPHIFKMPYVRYHHYAFCKGAERFELKKRWWETRFGEPFDYGWKTLEDGSVEDGSGKHPIYEYESEHPAIMKKHPMWRKDYE